MLCGGDEIEQRPLLYCSCTLVEVILYCSYLGSNFVLDRSFLFNRIRHILQNDNAAITKLNSHANNKTKAATSHHHSSLDWYTKHSSLH